MKSVNFRRPSLARSSWRRSLRWPIRTQHTSSVKKVPLMPVASLTPMALRARTWLFLAVRTASASGASLYTECAIAIENVHRMTRSHATIDVRRIRPDVREFRDKRMMGSEVAHRVRCGGIAGEREGLAATAAEIELAARAACARLLHPCG